MNDGIVLKGVKIHNLSNFNKFKCKFNNNSNYVYGEMGAGKSFIGINGIQMAINGIAERNNSFWGKRIHFIGKLGASGDIEYEFKDNRDDSSFFIKNHVTKAGNSITFRKGDGTTINEEWLNNFLNIAFLSASNFCSLSGIDQAKALGIDTSTFDLNIKKYKEEITLLNREIKNIGEILEVDKINPINIDELKEKKNEIKQRMAKEYSDNVEYNKKLKYQYDLDCEEERSKVRKFNEDQVKIVHNRNDANDCLAKLVNLGYEGQEVKKWILSLPVEQNQLNYTPLNTPVYIKELADTKNLDEIDSKIEQAQDINNKAKDYQNYLIKASFKKDKLGKVIEWNNKVSEEESARVNYINQTDFGFKGLSTDENGSLIFKDRPIKKQYFSTGELEIIVAKLAMSRNPLLKVRFIDELGILSPKKQDELVSELIDMGFQVIASVPGENVNHDNVIVLKDCALLNNEKEKGETLL